MGIYLSSDSKKRPNKDVNTRYLALDAMAKLSKYTSGSKILKSHTNVIISSLRDNDISIRRKALELMFLVCTEDNVKLVTKEMLLYFREDEPQLKEDIALKVAILSEKFASDFKWYIESILKMIELAGDFVSEDIIFRFMQIISGFEKQEQSEIVQKYAVEKIMKLLEKEYIPENGIKLACLIFGEFGYLINTENPSNLTVYKTFINLINKHMHTCSYKTILIKMSALMKLTKFSNDMLSIVIPAFEDYLESWNPELQQRAVEYIILCKTNDENIPDINSVREKVFSRMPVFNIDHLNNSILMKRLSEQNKSLYSKTKEGAQNIKETDNSQSKTNNTNNNEKENSENKDTNNFVNKSFTNVNMDKLSEMVSKMEYDIDSHPFDYHTIFQKDQTAFAAHINKMYEYAEKIEIKNLQNNYSEFRSFITNINNVGKIFENEHFKIDIKLKCLEPGVLGSMIIISTDSETSIDNLEFVNYSSPSGLDILVSKIKFSEGNKSAQLLIKTKILDSYVQPAIFNISGNFNNVNVSTSLALPVVLSKFLDYYDVTVEEYTAMWLEFSSTSSDETQRFDSIMTNPLSEEKSIMKFLKKIGGLLSGIGFKVFSPSDSTNYHEIEACAILIYQDKKMIPILVQVSFVPSFPSEFRFSLRTKNKDFTLFSNLTLDIYSIIKFFINPK